MGTAMIPRRNQPKNDLVTTPDYLASQIVGHFMPQIGVDLWCMDPCAGEGAFERAMCGHGALRVDSCEKTDGWNFFDHHLHFGDRFDLICSNPPYSILSDFLEHSFKLADNVVYLIQPPAALFVKRRRLAREAGFGIREIYYVECPPEWKALGLSFGTGLGAVHWERGWTGPTTHTNF